MSRTDELLINTKTDTWQQLEAAITNPDNPFRYLTLCTVDQRQEPQARILVLRNVVTEKYQMEFHTDIRSAKWLELKNRNVLTVIGYDPEQRLQLRFRGSAKLLPPGNHQQASAWKQLSASAKQGYRSPAPGKQRTTTEPPLHSADSSGESIEPGSATFGVIQFFAQELDWFEHKTRELRRARHTFANTSTADKSTWINP